MLRLTAFQKSAQIQRVPLINAESVDQFAMSRDRRGLVRLPMSLVDAQAAYAEEGPAGARASEIERLVERLEDGEGERTEQKGDQNHAEIGNAERGEVEKEDSQRGDPRDDGAHARDRHEELAVRGVVQNLGVHVAFGGGGPRMEVQPAAKSIPKRLPALQSEERRRVDVAHPHGAADERGERGLRHEEEPAGRVFVDETVGGGDERRVVGRGTLADGGAGHEGVVVDRLERGEADYVRFHYEETQWQHRNGEYSGQRSQRASRYT